MQRNVYVPLPREAIVALTELARREFRDPRSQAAILIVEGLRRAGLNPDADAGKLRRPGRVIG